MRIRILSVSRKVLAIAAAGFFSTAGAATSNLNLLVEHDITEVGADGVTRNLHFEEHVYRRDNVVWVERVIPRGAASHDGRAHADGGREHKHLDLASAALWIALEHGKLLNVRLVNAHDKKVIGVPAAEYGNIGFDGNWENAWHLLDPRQLKSMKPSAVAAPAGMRWYETATGNRRLRVLWDEQAAIPRRVESVAEAGATRKRMTAKDIAAPKAAPWTQLSAYERKEYSDYLD